MIIWLLAGCMLLHSWQLHCDPERSLEGTIVLCCATLLIGMHRLFTEIRK